MKFNFLICFLFIFALTLVSAESVGEFQLNIDDVQIYQTCNNCTYCNFTQVMGPNNQSILSGLEASNSTTYFFFDVAKENFTRIGTHTYCYDCGNEAEKATGCNTFDITYTGGEFTLQMGVIYLSSVLVLIFLFVLIVMGTNKLPSKDATDEEGLILQVSNLKHLRPVLWSVAWGIVMAIMFIVANMSIAYLPNNMVGEFFFNIYQVMFWLTMIVLPLWFIGIFVKIYQDKQIKEMIERGVQMRSNVI